MSLGLFLVLLGLLALPITLAGAAAAGALVPSLVVGAAVGLGAIADHGERHHVS